MAGCLAIPDRVSFASYPIGYHQIVNSWAGNLIKLARIERGLSQRDLARLSATSQPAIAVYEAGRKDPSLSTLTRILRAAGFDPRIRLVPTEDHDDWVRRYEAMLPLEAVERVRMRDRELLQMARRERPEVEGGGGTGEGRRAPGDPATTPPGPAAGIE
ncbi:MAG TPA: helix-turn-helix domain-containing protein [Actinomycetota bacterium]